MKRAKLSLSSGDKTTLSDLLKKTNLKTRTYKRILCLQELDKGQKYGAICELLDVSKPLLSNLSKRYRETGLDCLYDLPRPDRPIAISQEIQDSITILSLESAPAGHSQWSLRLLADRVVELGYRDSISHTQVHTILKKTKSNPIW
jgi:putative transposase